MLTWDLWLGIALGAAAVALLFALCSVQAVGILQQEGYSGRAVCKWYLRKGNMLRKRYSLLCLSLVLLTLLFNVCFSFLSAKWANLISFAPFLGMTLLFLFASRRALKVPLRVTGRVKRLFVVYFVLLYAVSFGVEVGFAYMAAAVQNSAVFLFRFVPVCLLALGLPFVLIAANFLTKAYEEPHNRRFVRKAQEALQKSPCVKVGITGSFGKTSVKNFIEQIASAKYRVIATPASYNTPMGIALTVKEKGTDCDVFVAEMGARKTGDIKELCDLVSPELGVVTGVCPQHLETFLSLENIKREKGELARRTKVCVLGGSAAELSAGQSLVEGVDFAAENVRLTREGCAFTLRIGSETTEVKTALLGRHAAEDIALAAALCSLLPMTAEEIQAGIRGIRPVEHRLRHIAGAGNVDVLDDSYNSNIEGAKNAVETLRLFGGKRYVVTPGLVELGELEEEENEKLGGLFAGLDGVILVGETRVLPVRKGYLEAGGDEAKLKIAPTLEKASELLQTMLVAGDCVLFLNDLPDKY